MLTDKDRKVIIFKNVRKQLIILYLFPAIVDAFRLTATIKINIKTHL